MDRGRWPARHIRIASSWRTATPATHSDSGKPVSPYIQYAPCGRAAARHRAGPASLPQSQRTAAIRHCCPLRCCRLPPLQLPPRGPAPPARSSARRPRPRAEQCIPGPAEQQLLAGEQTAGTPHNRRNEKEGRQGERRGGGGGGAGRESADIEKVNVNHTMSETERTGGAAGAWRYCSLSEKKLFGWESQKKTVRLGGVRQDGEDAD